MGPRKPTWSAVATHGVDNARALTREQQDEEQRRSSLAPSASQEGTIYTQAQGDEVEALKAIYMDDFEDVALKGAWRSSDRAFRLRLRAYSDPDTFVTLSVRFTATYPRSLPPLAFEDVGGLRLSTVKALERFLIEKPKELLGEVMIFEIGTGIQEILEDAAISAGKDDAFPSLEEERAEREAEANRLAQQHEEEQLKRSEEREAEEERVLKQMVDEEMSRRKEMKKRSKVIAPADVALDSSGELAVRSRGAESGYMTFDRIITLQENGDTFEFSAVSSLAQWRDGSVTEVFAAKPVVSTDPPPCVVVVKRAHVRSASSNDARLKKEIQGLEEALEALKKLRHQHLVNVLDFRVQKLGADAESHPGEWQINVVTEFANKGSLEEMLELVEALPVAKVRSWTVELLEALDFLHRHDIVHRRIHPGNILICRPATGGTASVKLADAGFQEHVHTLSHPSRPNSTPDSALSAFWVATEISADAHQRRTRKTDVWDLGIIFIQMIFGPDAPRQHASPTSLLDHFALSESLEAIVRKFFKSDPRKRPGPFELIPSEFLRGDAPVFSRPASPRLKRTSIAPVSQTARLRRESSSMVGTPSRYEAEWVELGRLGKGGYGEVVKARNKLENRVYAIKKITLNTSSALTDVLTEVMFLSQLNHPYVVRYFTVWPEEEVPATSTTDDDVTSSSEPEFSFSVNGRPHLDFGPSTGGLDFISSSGFPKIEFGVDSDDDEAAGSDEASTGEHESADGPDALRSGPGLALKRTVSSSRSSRPVRTTLYIQMEHCERHTLRDLIRKGLHANADEVWRLFRQILEGLAHIHAHGIIHRDLKPDNVFIDIATNPRIGDFGLATPGHYHAPHRAHAGGHMDGGDMTRSIGTALYVAPELRSHVGGSYNDKVDMYSLGIIFFEMCYPLHTAMERDRVLRQLREKEHRLPGDFGAPDKALQASIITALISHRPSERPSSAELLHSGTLPIQIEDETIQQALQGLSDPRSPYYQKMMSALFSPSLNKEVKDVSWELGAANGAHAPSAFDVVLQSHVKERLVSVFRRHGAVETPRQLLLPRSSLYDHKNVVQLLDTSGTLVQLPFDLTMTHARAIARHEPAVATSFAFGSVYRDAYNGGAPRSNGEADFDIVSTDARDLALKEAEVVKVLDEVIDAFPSLSSSPMCFHLNHSHLLDLIMDFCRIGPSQRPAVTETLSKLNIQQWTWQRIRTELRAPPLGVSSTSLDDLARFDFRDPPEKAFARLDKIFTGSASFDRAQGVFAHLRSVVRYLALLEVGRKVFLSPLSSFNERFYAGGVMFQCLFDTKRRDVLAAGGRYDSLVEEHRPKVQGHFTGCHAVGMNLGWDRVVASMARYHRNASKSTFLKKPPDEHSSTRWTPRRCDILVASFDPAVLRSSGVRLVGHLWAHDLSAELAIDARSPEELLAHYRDDRHSWIVTIRPESSAAAKAELRVKSIHRKEDTDIRTSDLLSYLRSELRDRDGREVAHSATRAHLFRTSSSTSATLTDPTAPSDKSNVQILAASHKSKKANRGAVIDSAQARTRSLLHSYMGAPIIAIETRDEILESMREARLSDPDSWRRLIQAVPLVDRKYLGDVHDTLLRHRTRWTDEGASAESRIVFVMNFRGGGVIVYDLGV